MGSVGLLDQREPLYWLKCSDRDKNPWLLHMLYAGQCLHFPITSRVLPSVAGSQSQAQGQPALLPAPSHKLMAQHPASQLLVKKEAALETPSALPGPGSHPASPTHLLLRVLKWNHKNHVPGLQLQLVSVGGRVIVHGLDLQGQERSTLSTTAYNAT